MLRTATLCLALGLLAQPAAAGPDYSAEDIIRHFGNLQGQSQPAAAAVPNGAEGKTRQVFIGTEGFGQEKPLDLPKTGSHNPVSPSDSAGATANAAPQQATTPVATPTASVRPGKPAKPRPAASREEYDLLITFELDSDRLTPRARQNLDEFARALGDPSLAGLRFLVEGHTDAAGSAAYNRDLSNRRAASVVQYLTEHGIAANRLQSRGHGESQPLVNDPYAAQNRRVETRILR